MNLNQTKHFLSLAATLNFTEAARLSGVSQPSLTKSIRRLEEELGGALVYRDGKHTRLTALGRDVQIEFMRIQAVLENVAELAETSALEQTHRLSVGIATTIAPGTFGTFWSHVLDQLPSVELEFRPLEPGESEVEVLSGKYDLCLLANPPRPGSKLFIQPLFKERLKLAVAKTHPFAELNEITPEQMAEEPYLDRLHCEFRSQLIEYFMDRSIVMRPRLYSEREDWVQQMVAQGQGVCSLPERSSIVEGLSLKSVSGLTLEREVTLVGGSASESPREVRRILELARRFDWEA